MQVRIAAKGRPFGNPAVLAGRPVRVTFKDGRELHGIFEVSFRGMIVGDRPVVEEQVARVEVVRVQLLR
jgi:hypothetical protein